MIIFDTNILRGVSRANPKFDVLRALKHSGVYSVGIPWMVLEELTARQALEYAASHERASTAVNDLNRKSPWDRDTPLPAFDFERAKEYWHDQYAEVLEILETSEKSAKETLAREAYCEKPAKTDPSKKGGARDVAIWLSVIDYLRENPTETVYFVSNNSRDFGDGTNYPSPMAEDLGEMESRLVILASFDEVISRFTEIIEADSDHVKELLTELVSDSSAWVEQTVNTSLTGTSFDGTRFYAGYYFEASQWQNWVVMPAAVVRNVGNASGHKIADAEWYTATVDWILAGFAVAAPQLLEALNASEIPSVGLAICEWSTKVLLSTDEDQEPTIVDFEQPRALDPAERDEWQPLAEAAMAKFKPRTETIIPQYRLGGQGFATADVTVSD